MKRWTMPFLAAIGITILTMTQFVAAQAVTLRSFSEDAKQAAVDYSKQKAIEVVRTQSKAAIVALYRKVHGKSELPSELLDLAEQTADAYASGDSEKMQEASEKVALKFGEELTSLASNPATRDKLNELLGKADTVKEVAQALGNATAGTASGRKAAAEYVGEALIGLTPAAGVIGFYKTAVGAMKYVEGQYKDLTVEEIYQDYKNGDDYARDALIMKLRNGNEYHLLVGMRRRELEQEKIDAIADAADRAGDKLRQHLTETTQDEIVDNIIGSFKDRIKKEKDDKLREAASEKAAKEAETILAPLKDALEQKEGRQALKENRYNLDKYIDRVREGFSNVPELDPNTAYAQNLMSRVLASSLIYGKNSQAYADATAALNSAQESAIANSKGAPCVAETLQLALRLWEHGRQTLKAGNGELALSFFKNSLAICPDDKRAATVATLEKQLTGTEAAYLGTMQIAPYPTGTSNTLEMAVKDSVLAGKWSYLTSRDGVTHNFGGTITGTVLADGRITGTISGNFTIVGTLNKRNQWIEGRKSFTYDGQITGRMADATASGAIRITIHAGKENIPKNGTWQASRR